MGLCHWLISGNIAAGIQVNLFNEINILIKEKKKNLNFKAHLLKVIEVTASGTTGWWEAHIMFKLFTLMRFR